MVAAIIIVATVTTGHRETLLQTYKYRQGCAELGTRRSASWPLLITGAVGPRASPSPFPHWKSELVRCVSPQNPPGLMFQDGLLGLWLPQGSILQPWEPLGISLEDCLWGNAKPSKSEGSSGGLGMG